MTRTGHTAGPLFGGYLFIAVSGLLFIALGVFASSLSRNQAVAGILAFIMLSGLIIGGRWLGEATFLHRDILAPAKAAVDYVQIFSHYEDFTRGVVDSRQLLFYVSGTVIARSGTGVREMVTVRHLVQGEGVERIFPIHSPRIARIEIKKAGMVRRAKLYYLRKRVGKKTKIKNDVKRQGIIDKALKAAAEAGTRAAQDAAAKAKAEGGTSKRSAKKALKAAEAATKKK